MKSSRKGEGAKPLLFASVFNVTCRNHSAAAPMEWRPNLVPPAESRREIVS